jgi:hypothetical protein
MTNELIVKILLEQNKTLGRLEARSEAIIQRLDSVEVVARKQGGVAGALGGVIGGFLAAFIKP